MSQSAIFLPPPRQTRRGEALRSHVRSIRVTMAIVLILFDGWWLGYAAITVAWANWGENVRGQVVEKWTSSTRGRRRFNVAYTYPWDNRVESDNDTVSESTYNTVLPGMIISVRAVRIGPWNYSKVHERSAAADVFLVCMLGVFGNAFLLYPAWRAFLAPARELRLIKRGMAAKGRVTRSYRKGQDEKAKRMLDYEFKPREGPLQENTLEIKDEERWARSFAGQEVTVIYDPGKPSRNRVLEYNDYEFQNPSDLAAPLAERSSDATETPSKPGG